MAADIPTHRGLYNAPASYNCFVNVCAQVVWHCASARTALARCGSHTCFRIAGGDAKTACMLCALRGECVFHRLALERPVPTTGCRTH